MCAYGLIVYKYIYIAFHVALYDSTNKASSVG